MKLLAIDAGTTRHKLAGIGGKKMGCSFIY